MKEHITKDGLIDTRSIPFELKRFVKINGVVSLELVATKQDIDNLPRIEAKEERTAQFIRVSSESLMCTGCGHLFRIPKHESERNIAWSYCPYCGSKLEVK